MSYWKLSVSDASDKFRWNVWNALRLLSRTTVSARLLLSPPFRILCKTVYHNHHTIWWQTQLIDTSLFFSSLHRIKLYRTSYRVKREEIRLNRADVANKPGSVGWKKLTNSNLGNQIKFIIIYFLILYNKRSNICKNNQYYIIRVHARVCWKHCKTIPYQRWLV